MTVTTDKGEISGHSGGANGGEVTEKKTESASLRDLYSIPGILHYIQHEWAKFELERSRWALEKSELEARIAFLQGERKGQENLKNDLVRRIKMLEYALRQERAKLQRLKHGADVATGAAGGSDHEELDDSGSDSEQLAANSCSVSWRQGRQLLRQYLSEVGYTDTVIDVRSSRVRLLLGLQDGCEPNTPATAATTPPASQTAIDGATRAAQAKSALHAEHLLKEAERDVMSNFDFLQEVKVEVDDTDDEDDLSSEEINTRQQKNAGGADHVEEDMAAALSSLGAIGGGRVWAGHGIDQKTAASGKTRLSTAPFALSAADTGLHDVSLGELANLTASPEPEQCYDAVSGTAGGCRVSSSKLWTTKYTLRSHFDGIRSLVFHPIESVLVTASEDHTMKLWNLTRTIPAKKSAFLDVEPIYTFRGHDGPVLCVGMNPTGEQCYSGGQDGTVRVWSLPHSGTDPYDSYDSNVLHHTLTGHTDAVWALTLHAHRTQLLSCSADGTVRLWSPDSRNALLQTFVASGESGRPTAVDFVRGDCVQTVVAYTSGRTALYDVESGRPVLWLEGGQAATRGQANCVVSHPTMPLTVTGHEDCCIRLYDNLSGKLVHQMVAHQDAVTSLAIDPQGLHLLSASHDCSVRLWNLESKQCVQEITAHRKKCDESIHCVAFHPTKAFIASAGADAIAKVFV